MEQAPKHLEHVEPEQPIEWPRPVEQPEEWDEPDTDVVPADEDGPDQQLSGMEP